MRMSRSAPRIPGLIACQRLTTKRKVKRVINAVAAPIRSISSLACPSRTGGRGSTLVARASAAIPMGMLIKKMNCHPREAAMIPPSVGPIARPTAMLVALIPSALPRSWGGNASTTIA